MAPRAWMLLLALALSTPGLGEEIRLPDCTRLASGSREDVPTLAEVRACQDRAREELIARGRRRGGRGPLDRVLDRVDDLQRSEVKEFLRKHPDRAVAAEEPGRDPEPPKDFFEYFKGGVDLAKAKLRAYFGLAPEKPRPAVRQDAAQAVKKMIDDAKGKGLDEDAVRELQGVERGGKAEAEHLAETLKRYNKQFDENLDPGVKKYFKRRGRELSSPDARPASGD